MRDIIEGWLFNRIGVKLQKDELSRELRDGVLLARLFTLYDVANKKAIKDIVHSDNIKVCENNLRQLRIWFDILNVKFNDEIIDHIINGKTTTCLTLLYELYVALHTKRYSQFDYVQSESDKIEKRYLTSRITPAPTCQRSTSDPNKLDISPKKQKYPCDKTEQSGRSQVSGDFTGKTKKRSQGKHDLLYERNRIEDIAFVRNELKNVLVKPTGKTHLTVSICQTLQDVVVENQDAIPVSKPVALSVDPLMPLEKLAENASEFIPQSENVTENTERNELKLLMTENIIQQSGYEKQIFMHNVEGSYQNEMNTESAIKQLKQEPTTYLDYFSTCKTSEEEIAHQLEIINRMELHRRLYDEKIRKRNMKRLWMSKQIVNDLIDLVIKVAEHKAEPITNDMKSQWNQMFISGKPLFDDNVIEQEPIVISVDDQHSDDLVLVEEFDNYNHLIGDWYPHAGPDVSHDDLIVLAHIVYRMKNARLPIEVPGITAADIPRYGIASVLNGTLDQLTIMKLKTLLVKSKVLLADIESAISYCIECYKLEVHITPPTTGRSKNKGQDKSKAAKRTPASKAPIVKRMDQETQTTPSLLENLNKPKVLTAAAQIGMQIYNWQIEKKTFNLTDTPREYVRDALIEYLKCQPDITGWVLINYPSTLEEAYDLERALSGKSFPTVFQVDETVTDEQASDECEIQDGIKQSKLVHLPFVPEEKFTTYFTCYINVIKQETPDVKNKETSIPLEINSTNFEESEEEENVIDLNQIYSEQGILREFPYETINFNTLKALARIILQYDNNVDSVPSTEIFGQQVIQYYDQSVNAEAKSSAKTTKQSSNKKAVKGNMELDAVKKFLEQLLTANKTASNIDASTSKNDLSIPAPEEIEVDKFKVEPTPGENLAAFPITTEDAISLADLWEEMEDQYICNIEEVLQFIKRNEQLVPLYQNFIYKSINDQNTDDCECVNIVKEFVDNFNKTLETDCGVAHEHSQHRKLSNSIFNMERRLWQISEEKRKKSETRRRQIIKEGWIADEMITILKNYLSLMRIEVNRCNTTLQFLYKYYNFMCNIQPSLSDLPCLPTTNPSQLDCDEGKIRKTMAKILTDRKENSTLNPVCRLLDNALQYYVKEIGQLMFKIDCMIEMYKDNVTCARNEYMIKKNEQINNINKFMESKRESFSEEIKDVAAIIEADNQEVVNMFVEWATAVKSELDRLTCRIKIIRDMAVTRLNKLENDTVNIFYKIHDEMISNYLQENKSIDVLCNVFHSSIISRSPIRGEILADGNCVYIEEKVDLSSSQYDLETKVDDQLRKFCFTIKQLEEIARILRLASTNDGIIRRRTLLFLVEDMIAHDVPTKANRLFPTGWNKLSCCELNHVFTDAFGIISKLHWKDFIIYCLDIPQIDAMDIAEHKKCFQFYDKTNKGTVTYEDYFAITFWYQADINDIRRNEYNKSLKEFIFSLYKVDENNFDYVEFLLSFSKGEGDMEGFAKAIACLSGKCVILSETNTDLQDILIDYDQLISEMVRELLEEAFNDAFDNSHGLKLTEFSVEDIDTSPSANILTDILEFKELKQEGGEEEEEVIIPKEDKGTQTVPLTEIMYDQYVAKNKIYRWSTKVQASLINDLLQDRVYRVLEFQNNFVDAEELKCDINASLVKLEQDKEISIPLLVQEQSLQNIFSYVHIFKVFSFPSAIANKSSNPSSVSYKTFSP